MAPPTSQETSPVRLLATLMLIAAVAGGLLAVVQQLTAQPIEQAMRQEQLDAIKAVLPAFENDPDQQPVMLKTDDGHEVPCYVGRDQAGQPVGVAIPGTSYKGYSGELQIMVGITMDGAINGLRVLVMKETPGLGDGCTKPSFQDQFIGKSLDGSFKFKVQKDGGDVHQLTAATITSRAATDAIKQALEYFQQVKGQIQ